MLSLVRLHSAVKVRVCNRCCCIHNKATQVKLHGRKVIKSSNKFYSTNDRGGGGITIPNGTRAPLELSTGKLARLADGSAVAKLGNTSVMTTAVCTGKASTLSFLPLTVDYRQKAAAAGRIPTNFLRREMGVTEREILTGRMIDRSIRPLFPKNFNQETGLSCNLLSVDGVYDPEVLSVNAASAALAVSDIPWGPVVGAARVAMANNQVVVNPTRKEVQASKLNMVVAGTGEGLATMIEAEAKCLDQESFVDCVAIGLEQCALVADNIESLAKSHGKTKRPVEKTCATNNEILQLMSINAEGRLRIVYSDFSLDKQARDAAMFAVRDDVVSKMRVSYPDWDVSLLNEAFTTVSRNLVRSLIFDEGLRVDGRSLDQIRPISCEVNLHEPLHGSALFQRGQTQVFCTVALDSLHSALKLDPMSVLTGGVKEKNFMLHYEFPGYATGELSRGGINRRETGHGALAEKALKQVVPEDREFAMRLTSEVLESNGSSSMASICGGTLALLDAGVPLSESASGVAMGLVTRDGQHKVLTDIMGMEDFLGDMDFKLSSTRTGVTALQADVKIPGIGVDIVKEAVEKGVEANHRILDVMEMCLKEPRKNKKCWPVSKKLDVPAYKRGKFLGTAGINLRRITSETGVQVNPEEEGVWTLFAPSPKAMSEAEDMIQGYLEEEKIPELIFGSIYTAKILEVMERGLMVELHPAMDPVLLHNSQLSNTKVGNATTLGFEVGQDLQVKYYGRDPVTGSIRISRKVLTVSSAQAAKNLQKAIRRSVLTEDEDVHEKEYLIKAEKQKTKFDIKDALKGLKDVNNNLDVNEDIKDSGVDLHPVQKVVDDTKVEATECPKSMEVHVPVQNFQDLNKEKRKIDQVDEKYYEIDGIVNKLMNINIEINETKLRKFETTEKLEKIKSKVAFLSDTSAANSLLADAFIKDTVEKYRRTREQSKAIEESIQLLNRQYEQVKTELEHAKFSYLQAVSSDMLRDREETLTDDINSNENNASETLTITPEVIATVETNSKTESLPRIDEINNGFKISFNPMTLLDRDSWSLSNPFTNNKSESDVQSEIQSKRERELKDHSKVKEDAKIYTHKPYPTRRRSIYKPNGEDLEEKSFDPNKLLSIAIDKKAKVQGSLSDGSVVQTKLKKKKKETKIPTRHPAPTRRQSIDDKEGDMRALHEFYTNLSDPSEWQTPQVRQYVLGSVRQFSELLNWLSELEASRKWDSKTISDVTYGLSQIHQQVFGNIREIQRISNRQQFMKTSLDLIRDNLNKPEHYLVKIAQAHLDNIDDKYRAAVKNLSKEVGLNEVLEKGRSEDVIWAETREASKELKGIFARLWDVELNEERMADLDDWREERNHWTCDTLEVTNNKIDLLQSKINGLSRNRLENDWRSVEVDLKDLQMLKVSALLTWSNEMPEDRKPQWLTPDLTEFLKERCRRYHSLDEMRGEIRKSWLTFGEGFRKSDQTDLALDVLYSSIRSGLAKVKYSYIENRRHEKEIELYENWRKGPFKENRKIKEFQLEKLMRKSKKLLADVEEALKIYIVILGEGDSKQAREAANILDQIRDEKRAAIKEIGLTFRDLSNYVENNQNLVVKS